MEFVDIDNAKKVKELAKSLKNGAKVGVKDSCFVIKFNNPIKFEDSNLTEFTIKKPTTTQVEASLEGLDPDKDGATILKRLLSSTISIMVAPDEVGNVFAPEELGAFEKVLAHFLD
jgi:hypothetical protein